MAVHAIGDRANHEVLDAYEQLRRFERERGLPPLKHRVSTCRCSIPMTPAGWRNWIFIASMQPIHATSDMYMADRYWGERRGAFLRLADAVTAWRAPGLWFRCAGRIAQSVPGLHAALDAPARRWLSRAGRLVS